MAFNIPSSFNCTINLQLAERNTVESKFISVSILTLIPADSSIEFSLDGDNEDITYIGNMNNVVIDELFDIINGDLDEPRALWFSTRNMLYHVYYQGNINTFKIAPFTGLMGKSIKIKAFDKHYVYTFPSSQQEFMGIMLAGKVLFTEIQ